jgi:SAM-dependent methyltransferase
MPHFSPKRLSDGRALLNLGCGWKMHRAWTNLDFSPYAKLVSRPWLVRGLKAAGVLTPTRSERLAQIDPDIVCWDLRHGIPYADGTFSAVYHSHFLEHLDRAVVPGFLRACRRVLAPGGVIRVVVPDWELLTRWYTEALDAWDRGDAAGPERHAQAMHDLIDQMVRSDATGANTSSLAGRLENWWRGGAAGTGELHRWMYDRRSLGALLEGAGFHTVTVRAARESGIAGWAEFSGALDLDELGRPYKPESLYLEAIR